MISLRSNIGYVMFLHTENKSLVCLDKSKSVFINQSIDLFSTGCGISIANKASAMPADALVITSPGHDIHCMIKIGSTSKVSNDG